MLPRNNKTHTPIFELYPLGSSSLSMPSCSKEFILKHSKPKMSKTPHEPSQWEDGKSQVIGSLSKNVPLKMKLDTVWIKNLATFDPKNVVPFYWPPFAEKEQSHNATSSRGTTTLKVMPCCICWIAAFWWLIVSWPTKAVKTWSNTSHQAGKPKKITRKLSSTILGWGKVFWLQEAISSAFLWGTANQLLFQLGVGQLHFGMRTSSFT